MTDDKRKPAEQLPKSKTILVVDDDELLRSILKEILNFEGFRVEIAGSGDDALEFVAKEIPSLIVLDVGLPGMSGRTVCQKIRETYPGIFLPILLISGDTADLLVEGLKAGANDFIPKPFKADQIRAKVKSFIDVKGLYDNVQEKAISLADKSEKLENRITHNISQLNQLKRFLSPQVADYVVSADDLSTQKSRRKDVTVVFVDLRGFTAFAEKYSPEEVSEVLSDYYREVGTEVLKHQGSIGCLAGDGIMSFFNDPIELENHFEKALHFTLAVRERLTALVNTWNAKNYQLHFGIGVATGVATIGIVGFEGYWDYAVIGAVSNLAARLCSNAQQGQILISKNSLEPLQGKLDFKEIATLKLKGIPFPVLACDLQSMTTNLRRASGE